MSTTTQTADTAPWESDAAPDTLVATVTASPPVPQPTVANQTLMSPVTGLFPHHYAELQRSGLSDETMRAAGILSEVNYVTLATKLNWRTVPKKMPPAMVIPYRSPDGQVAYSRFKFDHPRTIAGKVVKYESPKGQPNQIYLPPGVAEILLDATHALLLTEGEKKALAATQAGFLCIGLVGVHGWADGKAARLLPALERIAWQGRVVYIVFDSDAATKPEVQDAENRLSAHLAARGAVVRVARLPEGAAGPDGKPTKVGLDDYLVAAVANGLDPAGEMRKLLDGSQEPNPVDAVDMKAPASEIDSVPEATAFLAETEKDGVPRLRFWRGTWLRWRSGAYRVMPPSEVRGEVVEFLDRRFSKLTQMSVGNVLDGLRAKSRLSHQIEPPAWIGDVGDALQWKPTDVLVCRNGLIHLPSLTTGQADHMRKTTPRLFVTAGTDYDFAPDAPRPDAWLEFLASLWPDDAESVGALQEWMGYFLTADTAQQKILMVIGPRRSGKGTICRTMTALVGKANVCGPTLASLSTNFGLWPFIGKSLAIISDARLGGRTDSQIVVERLLSISGEDSLTIDRKNLEPLTVKLSTRLMLCSNELPRLGDSSGALAGRMILLRLTQSFYGREDHALTDKLLGELPGILLWAIEGWRRLHDRGRFLQPAAADEMRGEMEDLASPVGAFVRDRCTVGPECEVIRSDLHSAYTEWAKAKGKQHTEDETGFGRSLRAVLPMLANRQHRIGGVPVRFYAGLGLK